MTGTFRIPERAWDVLLRRQKWFRRVRFLAAVYWLGCVPYWIGVGAHQEPSLLAVTFTAMVLLFLHIVTYPYVASAACPACGSSFTTRGGRGNPLATACEHCETLLTAAEPGPGIERFPLAAFGHARGFRLLRSEAIEGVVRGAKVALERCLDGQTPRIVLERSGTEVSDAALAQLSERVQRTLPGAQCVRVGPRVRVECEQEGVGERELDAAIEGMVDAGGPRRQGVYR